MARKPSSKTLTKRLDTAWSRLVRSKGYCERCGRRDSVLNAHHIVGRMNRKLRWCPRNGVALCYLCHRRWAHDHPLEFTDWIRTHRPLDAAYVEKVKYEIVHHTDKEKREILEDLTSSLEREAA